MRQISVKQALLATAAFAFGTFASIDWSPSEGPFVVVESAQARVGRPLTPVSVAGVRDGRRAARWWVERS